MVYTVGARHLEPASEEVVLDTGLHGPLRALRHWRTFMGSVASSSVWTCQSDE